MGSHVREGAAPAGEGKPANPPLRSVIDGLLAEADLGSKGLGSVLAVEYSAGHCVIGLLPQVDIDLALAGSLAVPIVNALGGWD